MTINSQEPIANMEHGNVMSQVERMAGFAHGAGFRALGADTVHQLKVRILDSLGCGLGALHGEPVQMMREYISEFGYGAECTLIGGGSAGLEHAVLYNSALIRYLDFNDSYMAKGETCHPSDNLGAIMAAGEFIDATGRDLMVALAVAYQIQCQLCDVAPVRARGFDHTVQGAYAVAAGVSKILGLDRSQTANALAISGTAFNALRVTRTGKLSHWKGLAYPNLAACCVRATLLARQGITGPLEVIEGDKGFMDAIAGFFQVSWSDENLAIVGRTTVKKYNAEIHSQTAIDAVLTLLRKYQFSSTDIKQVNVETFDVAYNIIGGGEEGDKKIVTTKEEADHSLPYILAVAILDGQVMPEQYKPERIHRSDVQALLSKISIHPRKLLSERFPDEMPCRVKINLHGGRVLEQVVKDYEGFFTRPMPWGQAVEKFSNLASQNITELQRATIVKIVMDLEHFSVRELMKQLGSVVPHSGDSGDVHFN